MVIKEELVCKGEGCYKGGGGYKGVYISIYDEHIHHATIDVYAPMISPLSLPSQYISGVSLFLLF